MICRRSSRSQIWWVVAALAIALLATWFWPLPGSHSRLPLDSQTATNPRPLLQILQQADDEQDVLTPSGRLIRVNVTPTDSSAFKIRIDAAYDVRLPGTTSVIENGTRLRWAIVRPSEVGILIGRQEHSTSRIEIVTPTSPAIWIGDHQYRGRIRIYRISSSRLLVVNVLDIEEYVASVIDSEMPLSFGDQARTAQAVVARSFALYQQATVGQHREFDVYATTRSQKYLGFQYRSNGRRLAGESRQSRNIASSTRGLICVDENGIFCPYYSATCGGESALGLSVFRDASSVLQVRPCRWCRDAPLYRWSRSVDLSHVQRRFDRFSESASGSSGQLTSISTRRDPDSGHTIVRLIGTRDDFETTGNTFRSRILPGELPSPHFHATSNGNVIEFRGRGHGHGVGMCQWGARGQAAEGRTWINIIKHYYPGARLVRLDLSH